MNVKLAGMMLAILAVAGCSSTSTSAATLARPPIVDEVAAQAGCTGWQPTTGPLELFVKDSGTCHTFAGQLLNVETFNTSTSRDSYIESAREFGGWFGSGPLWAIWGEDLASVEDAVKAAGGTMVS